MSRITRAIDARLLLGLLVGVAALALVAVFVTPLPGGPPLSIRSGEADGAMVLRLWLEQSGYHVRELLSDSIDPEGVDALFVLNPLIAYSPDEAARIRDWVRRGKTLIVTGRPGAVGELLEPFRVSLSRLPEIVATLSPSGLTLLSPPVDSVRLDAIFEIQDNRRDVAVHFSDGGTPIVASFAEGGGTVWVSGAARPFSNRGLSDPGSARLILNMLARVPAGATIGFDEASHGYTGSLSIFGWLVGTSPGWSIVVALSLTMVYLALRGRRFGHAIPIPEERLRREPVEYIQAMANLFRRSGQRADMLKHYRHQFRRRLSERYALDPKLGDAEMAKTVAARDPLIDESALRGLLGRLKQDRIGESGLIEVAREVDDWLRRLM
jgi:hypothetical protein